MAELAYAQVSEVVRRGRLWRPCSPLAASNHPEQASPEGRARRRTNESMWHMYILECTNDALYIGTTNNIERRFNEHISGSGGHYTSYAKPIKILYKEAFKLKSQAENRERQIKRWSKAKKCALINGDFEQLKFLSVSRD